jgi:4a-hydroxytetrahydrobiopterin dehydratase
MSDRSSEQQSSANNVSEKQFSEQHCVPCEGGMQAMTREQAEQALVKLNSGWELDSEARMLKREFRFKGYNKTIGFVNALAWIANEEGHHPDLEVSYDRCLVRWTTHAVGGLSENDFICAAKTSLLTDRSPAL